MVTKSEIDNLIRIGQDLQTKSLKLMAENDLIYDKIGGNYGGIAFISASGNYKWSFSNSEEGIELCGKWQQWFGKISPLFKEYPNNILYRNFCSTKQIIECGWREHNNSRDSIIDKHKSTFSDLNKYLENIKEYASEGTSEISINTEQLNMTINTQQLTVLFNNVNELLCEIKNKIETEDLRVINEEYIQIVDDAINSNKDKGKIKKALDRFKTSVQIVNPSLQVISSAVSIASLFFL